MIVFNYQSFIITCNVIIIFINSTFYSSPGSLTFVIVLMRVKWIFAVIKNITKARDPGNEVVLFNMNFPKEFMNLCRQPVAQGATFFYNSFAILMKLLPSGQNLVTFSKQNDLLTCDQQACSNGPYFWKVTIY